MLRAHLLLIPDEKPVAFFDENPIWGGNLTRNFQNFAWIDEFLDEKSTNFRLEGLVTFSARRYLETQSSFSKGFWFSANVWSGKLLLR